MAEIIDNGHVAQQHIPNGKINAGLTLGIIGTSLAGLMALNGNNGNGLLSSLFGGNNGGCGCGQSYQTSYYPMNYCYGGNNTSTYAIILVLFILLVIVIGTRFSN